MNREKRISCKAGSKISEELKAYFLIFNLVLATIAFAGLVSAAEDTGAKAISVLNTWGSISGAWNSIFGSSKTTPETVTPNPTRGPGTSGSAAAVIGSAPATGNPVAATPSGETKIPAQIQDTNIPAYQYFEDFVKAHPQAESLARFWGYGAEWDLWKAKAYAKKSTPATGNPVSTDPTKQTPPGTVAPVSGGDQIPPMTSSPTVAGSMKDYFTGNLMENLKITMIGAGAGLAVGYLAGGKQGWLYGALAGGAGTFTYQILKKLMPGRTWLPILGGAGVAAAIFLLTYKKDKKEFVEFQCNPWQAPTGGSDCEKCNGYAVCDEYTCKSLGQACDLVNKGTQNQSCVWKNPRDTNSPTIEMVSVTKGNHFDKDTKIRPPATGVEILIDGGKCIKAFTPLAFTFKTNEPAQCKIDYNLTTDSKTAFDSMGYYVGGDNSFSYNHSEKLSLPGPEAMNKANPGIQNDGTYTLYVRCQDANGNYNVNPFSVRFCVDPGPDTTAPVIVNVSIPNGMPIQFNKSNLSIDVYINEPADCKWSREDRAYDNMEGNMSCSNNLWEMNNEETYTCRAKLTGIKDRKENIFYFRCMDKPDYESGRNVNTQSFVYRIKGTQPLNILKIEPDATVKGATDVIAVNMTIKTDNGYNNGEAICYYSQNGKEDSYIEFSDSGGNLHKQRQDLVPGNYSYYYKCIDLGGNTVYNSTNFVVESDREMPIIIRIDKQSGELRIVSDKEAECSYSNADCNFEIESGIQFSTTNKISHFAEWKTSKNYYVRCRDKNNNQPDPNVCTVIVRPIDLFTRGTAIEL